MWLLALTACGWLDSPSPADLLPPRVVDRSGGRVELGAPEGVGEVQVVAFGVDGARWVLAGVAVREDGFERWVGTVAEDGTVRHAVLGEGRIHDADLGPDGTLWLVGYADGGGPWVGALDRSGAVVAELRPEVESSGELWAVRATEEGAHALGIHMPLVLGEGDAWWIELDRDGAVRRDSRGGYSYSYANELDVDGAHELAVGELAHRGRLWRRDGERVRGERVLEGRAGGLEQVRRDGEGWLVLGKGSLDGPPRLGQLGLYRLPDEGEPELLAWTDELGPVGDATSLWPAEDGVWLHTVGIHGNRWQPTDHRVFRQQGERLVPVGEARPGWGALALSAGVAWRAYFEDGSVWVERLEP